MSVRLPRVHLPTTASEEPPGEVLRELPAGDQHQGRQGDSEDHPRVADGLDRFADRIPVVPLHEANRLTQLAAQPDALEEVLQKGDAPELREADPNERNAQIAWTTARE